MDHKLVAVIGVVMCMATVGAYSSDAAASDGTQGSSALSYIVAASDGTANTTTSGDTTSSTVSDPQHRPRPHRIVCVGDSITEGFADPNNWPYHLKERLGDGWEVVDQGVGGAKTADMCDRLEAALNVHPGFVVIMGGINDLARGESLETIERNIDTMCTHVESHGAAPVLCTVTPTGDYPAQKDALNAWITEYAHSKGYDLIDFYAALNDASSPGHADPALVFDGTHPNSAGYTAMADAIDLAIFTRGAQDSS